MIMFLPFAFLKLDLPTDLTVGMLLLVEALKEVIVPGGEIDIQTR
jgi:hypothetical protein